MPALLLTGDWSDRPFSSGKVREWAIDILLLRDLSMPTELLGTRSVHMILFVVFWGSTLLQGVRMLG